MLRLFVLSLSLISLPLTAAKLNVVASFSILGDMVHEIGGNTINLTTIVGPNEDTHQYQPRPHDIKAVKNADLIFINGLHFESWFTKILKSSNSKAPVFVATTGIKPRMLDGKIEDPHCWHHLEHAQIYVKNITDGLIKAMPGEAPQFKERAAAYAEKLKALHKNYTQAFAKIPADKRVVITSHDAFNYLGAAYGIQFIAPLGISTDTEPSPKDIKNVVDKIKTLHIKALFAEASIDKRLIQQIGRESGVTIGGDLFSDALSRKEGPANTYVNMIKHNLDALLKALQ